MIKGSIQEEDTTIINVYAPKTGAPQYIKQELTKLKEEINNNIIIATLIIHSQQWIDRPNRESIRNQWMRTTYSK